jgi:chromate transport protein ChrA
LGTLEGVSVGLAQWLVLRRRLPLLRQRTWVMATALGAFVAWTLGMMPSSLMMLIHGADATPPPALSDAAVYALAAAMGAVLGIILGIPQWRVLRRSVTRAGWWVWANAAAWLVGMPLVFIGADSAPVAASVLNRTLIAIATIAAAGALVGAVHGLALLWLLRASRTAPLKPISNFETEK